MRYEVSDVIHNNQLFLIAGPCVIENREITFQIAEELIGLCNGLNIKLIFKASFRKANRTSVRSFTGIGDQQAINILHEAREYFQIPVTTDVHQIKDIELVAGFVDLIQIPAFLSRQTLLLQAAGRAGKPVNIKKGQFMSATAMQYAAEKLGMKSKKLILITERGNFFGYEDLVVDFRNVPRLKAMGFTTLVDCTHSLQKPNQNKGVTDGEPDLVSCMCNATVAVGSDGIFLETHPDPKSALSDSASMISIKQLESIIRQALRIKSVIE